jgi:ABC-2 type transport system permease protein
MILVRQVQGLAKKRQVLVTLVNRDLRVRYAGSGLGYLWTVIDPLAMAMIYFVVFTLIFQARHVGYQPYVLFLIIGVLCWQWFSQSVTDTSRALLNESRLVRSTNLPRELWVVRVVVAKGIEFLLAFPVIAGFAAYFILRGEAELNWRLVLIPVAVILQFILLTGVGLMLAPVTSLVTDMSRVVRIALRMGFYATPILYGVHAVEVQPLDSLLLLNPMTGILELYRAGFFPEELNVAAVAVACVLSVGILVAGTAVFERLESAVLKEI